VSAELDLPGLPEIPPRRVVLSGAEVREQIVAYLEERADELAGAFSTYGADVLRTAALAIAGGTLDRIEPARRQAARYAEVLIAIVAQRWRSPWTTHGPYCPNCALANYSNSNHDPHCVWLAAALALGIA
jgi:hypothetical protein